MLPQLVPVKSNSYVNWPASETSPRTVCRACSCAYAIYATHPVNGSLYGRDRCPVCLTRRPIPKEMAAVFAQWYGLVASYTRRYVRYGLDESTAERVAAESYAEGMLRWAPGHNAQPQTFAGVHMKNKLLNALRIQKRGPAVVPLADFRTNGTGERDNHNPAELVDTRRHLARHTESRELAHACEVDEVERLNSVAIVEALQRIPQRYAEAIRRRFGLCKFKAHTYEEIGAALGLTKQRAAQIVKCALQKLERDTRFAVVDPE